MDRKGLQTSSQTAGNKIGKINWTKRKILTAFGSAILLVFVLFFLFRGEGSEAETIKIKKQNYEEKIVAVGQLQLARETTLIAEVSGEIETIGAKEGDIIPEESVIISIDDSDQAFQMKQKKATYDNASAEYQNLVDFDYASARGEMISQAAKKEQAQKSYYSAEKLYQEGVMSQIDYLEYKADYEAADAAWNTSRLRLAALDEGGSLRAAAYSKLKSAQLAYESAVNDQNKYNIAVPWNSILLKTYVNEHDYVRQGDPLADVGEAGSYHVVTELDEKYFPYLFEGLKAVVFLGDSEEGKRAEGFVDVISHKINDETGTFAVKVALPEAFPYQASDLTVNVEINISQKEDAIVIPKEYLIERESAVYLLNGGKAFKTKVQFEYGPSTRVLIIKGLAEGDTIIRPEPGIEDGEVVKAGKGVEAS